MGSSKPKKGKIRPIYVPNAYIFMYNIIVYSPTCQLKPLINNGIHFLALRFTNFIVIVIQLNSRIFRLQSQLCNAQGTLILRAVCVRIKVQWYTLRSKILWPQIFSKG